VDLLVYNICLAQDVQLDALCWAILLIRLADPQVYLYSEVNASKLKEIRNHMPTESTAQKCSIPWKLMSASMPWYCTVLC